MATFVEQVTDLTGWTSGTAELLRGAPFAPRETPPARVARTYEAPTRDRRNVLLNRVVEAEILPRLALVRRTIAAPQTEASPAIAAAAAAELLQLVLTEESASAIAFIDRLYQQGVTLESVYLGILTDTARQLGELWLADRADFVQVTISMGRLQQVLRAMSSSFQATAARRNAVHRVLLVPAPGEQHTLGLLMLGEFFRRAGWHIAGGPAVSGLDAEATVRGGWCDVAAFSIGSIGLLEGLTRCIRRVRGASRNRNLVVLVGGALFLERPELVARVGADTFAADAVGAVRQASQLLAMRAAAE
jgi:methanogenic corrinoid protein MtbC1